MYEILKSSEIHHNQMNQDNPKGARENNFPLSVWIFSFISILNDGMDKLGITFEIIPITITNCMSMPSWHQPS